MQHSTGDQQLVKRIKDGDSTAMPGLQAHYDGRVFSWLFITCRIARMLTR